jgi:hypothetical protein
MFMRRLGLAAVVALAAVVLPAPASAADDATLLRVFLKDGNSLVSYGEPALVGDHVVFSMPIAPPPNPPLHLVDLPLTRVDWDRTSRYANAARASHYVQTRAEADYAALSNEIARTLGQVAAADTPEQRITIVERARKALADWPQTHFNYRQTEVRQMLSMLDEALADLRAATGAQRFDLALTAYAEPPAITEPLLPPPTLQESIEQVLRAARSVDSSADRIALLATAMVTIDKSRATLPAEWAAAIRLDAEMTMRAEQRIDQSYRTLTSRTMTLADTHLRMGDVHALERLIRSIPERDAALGGKRPDAVMALVTAIEDKLDAARRLQLARDRWALRATAYQEYQSAIAAPLRLFAQLTPMLESIKALSGSTPASLTFIDRTTLTIRKLASVIKPPQELTAVHALFLSAVQLAANAAQIRREAVLAEDMSRAWNASSAAAGALMLISRANTDMLAVVQRPELR